MGRTSRSAHSKMLYKVEILHNSDQDKDITDIYIETTKQVTQIGAGPAIACSDTMLNTHGQQEKYEGSQRSLSHLLAFISFLSFRSVLMMDPRWGSKRRQTKLETVDNPEHEATNNSHRGLKTNKSSFAAPVFPHWVFLGTIIQNTCVDAFDSYACICFYVMV